MAPTLIGVVPELRQRTEGLLREGEGRLLLSEGFRTRAQQEVFWRIYLDGGTKAARPGTSNHEKGLAVDIKCAYADNALRTRLAKRWGLRLTVVGEAWHFELDPKRGPMPFTPSPIPTAALPIVPEEEDMPRPTDIVFSIATPSGKGRYKLGFDGGIFTTGDAMFYGSYPGLNNVRPQLGDRRGFWSMTLDIDYSDPLRPRVIGYTLCSADGGEYYFNEGVLADIKRLEASKK